MAPPPCLPRSLPALMKELVEEILLRIPPDEPAHLVRAALVCKPWRRILTDPGFLRRYHAFHRAAPLLGYLHNLGHDNEGGIPPFVHTCAASPLTKTLPPELEGKRTNWVLDSRHGRVLIHAFYPQCLVVWDPITGVQKNLSLPDFDHTCYSGAVLCAVDGCDHLNCKDGPFLVVFAGSGDDSGNDLDTCVAVYSSETGLWSATISIHDSCALRAKPPLLIRDTLYFKDGYNIIVKCDLGAHELALIEPPEGFFWQEAVLMEVDGGGLGFVCIEDRCLHMLSWQGDANNGTGGWAQHQVMELETLLPRGRPLCDHDVVGLMDGTNTVLSRGKPKR